jgi:hypothetical protein
MRRVLTPFFLPLVLSLLAGCGGGSSDSSQTVMPPTIPAAEVLLVGKLVQAAPGPVAAPKAGEPIEVAVVELPGSRVTVGSDGSFTLRGLPAGGFTVVFTQAGATIGTLAFGQVAANQQITITVEVVGGEVVLVDEDRRGIGHAGIELEGLVENVLALDAAGDSRFMIAGRLVIARPAVTAIREGTTPKTVADVTAGRQVHVKGTTIDGSTDVLAYEIKLQGPVTVTPGTPVAEEKVTICHIPPGNPSKKQTLSIGASAWPAHQAHGDTQGPC